jgi:hypothetical protein
MEATMSVQSDVLNLFNAIVLDKDQYRGRGSSAFTGLVSNGLVLDFVPTPVQRAVLAEFNAPLTVRTLFTREERNTADPFELIVVQLLHYIEVYGLGEPGLFNLERDNGTLVSLRYVRGITLAELNALVHGLLTGNAPVKDAEEVARIIEAYDINFNLAEVRNNELRVRLWREGVGAFENGDDAVRYLVYKATGSTMLIKSREVIAKMKALDKKGLAPFLAAHEDVLAQVFNRHKRLLLALKDKTTATYINRIARKSKTGHVPVRESLAKTFIAKAFAYDVGLSELSKVSVRDKLKYLNLLAVRRLQRESTLYRVRNGKVFNKKEGVPVHDLKDIARVEAMVLESLKGDLLHLRNEDILIPSGVDYGLPTSRKQTIGRLPFGTKVTVDANEISSGMYWENAWGARDLDLSTVNTAGDRVGWGQRSGYNRSDIVFSGDLTDASEGAMEFMTSKSQNYGLMVNIFAGTEGAEFELVVGKNANQKKQWITDTVIRERHKLDSRNCLIGFVKGREFVVYTGRLNNRRISGYDPSLDMINVDFWTVKRLLVALGIDFDLDNDGDTEYTYDLNYAGFSYDKLEDLFGMSA